MLHYVIGFVALISLVVCSASSVLLYHPLVSISRRWVRLSAVISAAVYWITGTMALTPFLTSLKFPGYGPVAASAIIALVGGIAACTIAEGVFNNSGNLRLRQKLADQNRRY
ncbi:MAG: hypothetical protein Q7S37_04940 [bacterium]|nr:hypothetical protein [bacterium]